MKCIDCELCVMCRKPLYLRGLDDTGRVKKLEQIKFMCKSHHSIIFDPFEERSSHCSLYIPRMNKED